MSDIDYEIVVDTDEDDRRIAERKTLLSNPLHPYTHALLAAVPHAHPRQKKTRVLISGDAPSSPRRCAARAT